MQRLLSSFCFCPGGKVSDKQLELERYTGGSDALLVDFFSRRPLVGMIFAAIIASAALTPADFEITSLPGLATPPTFKHYSGLLPIGDGKGTELFFWFVESARSPSKDPVVFWTNGGPGASSVAYGFWTEHGPFRLQNDTAGIHPVPYDYSWNRIANVLYVEMPSGVGFSHSASADKYHNITDAHAAGDTYACLLKFFEVFATFKANDLYITGESYVRSEELEARLCSKGPRNPPLLRGPRSPTFAQRTSKPNLCASPTDQRSRSRENRAATTCQ